MKPFFTIDAGEFLVGSQIQKEFPDISLWLPSKDDGDDLLLLNRKKGTFCSAQIKVSRDYLATNMKESFHPHLKCCGWFTPRRNKIQKSTSDFWILGLHSYDVAQLSLLIIPPKELLRRYTAIHGTKERLQSYFWLTNNGKVFETRGLKKKDHLKIVNGTYSNPIRDFTQFLGDWDPIRKKLEA